MSKEEALNRISEFRSLWITPEELRMIQLWMKAADVDLLDIQWDHETSSQCLKISKDKHDSKTSK